MTLTNIDGKLVDGIPFVVQDAATGDVTITGTAFVDGWGRPMIDAELPARLELVEGLVHVGGPWISPTAPAVFTLPRPALDAPHSAWRTWLTARLAAPQSTERYRYLRLVADTLERYTATLAQFVAWEQGKHE